jgi:hypothetical protein
VPGHLRYAAEAVEEGELGVDVEVNEVAVPARFRGSLGHRSMVVGLTADVARYLTSGGSADFQASDTSEVTRVPGQQGEPMLERRGRDEGIGQAYRVLASQASCTLGDIRVDGKVRHRFQKAPDLALLGGTAGEQLGAGDR